MNNRTIVLIFLSILFFGHLHCYDCGPLVKSWSLTLRGGIAPAVLANRGAIASVMCADPQITLAPAGIEQKFNEMWHNHPLIIEADIAYAINNNVELFGECAYHRAKENSSCFSLETEGVPLRIINLQLDAFQAIGGYMGFRWFSQRCFYERMSFFLGVKCGLVHYQQVDACPLSIEIAQSNTINSQTITWFEASNAVSSGLQIGFDCLLTCSFSLFFNAEVISSAAFKSPFHAIQESQDNIPAITFIREQSGTLVSFPLSLGLRFYFG